MKETTPAAMPPLLRSMVSKIWRSTVK